MPKLVLAPSFAVTLLSALQHWHIALVNIAIFASLYIVICTAVGLMPAIFLVQKIRGEAVLRPIYLYPMALSLIVTGTAWKWFLDPGIGLERVMHLWGWTSFSFPWIKDNDLALYCIVLAAVWQTSGLEAISGGEIAIKGRVVNGVHPSRRNIARVFQSQALCPNMTVGRNMTFGLEIRGVPKPARDRALADVARLLQIEVLLDRKPGQLSGGQRQRVAMGR